MRLRILRGDGEAKRDFIPLNARDGAEVSLRSRRRTGLARERRYDGGGEKEQKNKKKQIPHVRSG